MEPDPEEALTKEELAATQQQQQPDAPPNAFAQLMSTAAGTRAPPAEHFKDRLVLGGFIADPAGFPPSSVLYFDARFVAVRDKFPKATVHALLLPRSGAHTLRHPFDALGDAAFLAGVRAEAARLRELVAQELQRRVGDANQVSSGSRDWAAEVRVGVHAVPSLGNLHVHVLSRDMHSPAMKHRKHYNSFNTPFFVPLEDFPLHELDPRRDPGREGYLRRDLRCWRCGHSFGNRFRELKAHLDKEFEAWRRE